MLTQHHSRLLLQAQNFLLFLSSFFLFSLPSSASPSKPTLFHPISPPPDAAALLSFKSKADPKNHLIFSPNKPNHTFCKWQGVQCNANQKVQRLILQSLDLGGTFPPNTLSLLNELRVLSLQNNSLVGPIPDLSPLHNLKTLFLDNNHFTGSFPPSIITLHRLRTLDLSHNNLTGPIPNNLTKLDHFYYLNLTSNHFNGNIPPFNQSSLRTLDLTNNNFSGPIPVTLTLITFGPIAFSHNPNLCGEIIHIECHPNAPFFSPSSSPPPPPPHAAAAITQSAEIQIRPPDKKRHNRNAIILGFSIGVCVLIGLIVCFAVAIRRQGGEKNKKESSRSLMDSDGAATAAEAAAAEEMEEKVKKVHEEMKVVGKSGSLMFCCGEAQRYTMEQLMRASAELLGRGSVGTTYKAVLDNRLIVTVKRLDAAKMAVGPSKEMFDSHMESVGGLRHPNLVPLRAYFQAREERLLIYDYEPNGSLFSLVHGSRSSRARPLHWTSCLKIAEDVAQGLSYIHQAWRLVHGNLKSSNVLLGPDFEACITDYCLCMLANPSCFQEDPDSAAYRAPEIRNPNHQPSPKSDVYAYGVLLLELLTGKSPSEHPFLVPTDRVSWVKSVREDNGGGDNRMDMLVEVATTCSLTSPEQRPTMWQVLKMLQEIKEIVLLEDGALDPRIPTS